MNSFVYTLLYAVVVAGFFVLSLIIMLRRKDEASVNFALFSFFTGLWQALQLAAQIFYSSSRLSHALFALSIAITGVMTVFFAFFAAAYTKKRKPHYLLGFNTAIMFGSLAFLSDSITSAEILRTGIATTSVDVWYGTVLLFDATCCGIAVWEIRKYQRSFDGKQLKQQNRILLFIVLQSLVLVLVLSSFYASEDASMQILIPISSFITMVAVVYSMIFHGLFNIQGFVVRAFIYFCSLFVIVVLCVIPGAILAAHFFDVELSKTSIIVATATLVMFAYITQGVRSVFNKVTGRLFYRYYYDPQDILNALNDMIIKSSNVTELCERSNNILCEALQPTSINYFLHNKKSGLNENTEKLLEDLQQQELPNVLTTHDSYLRDHVTMGSLLEANNIAILVRLRTSSDENLGFMILGYKKSGQIYTQKDTKMLAVAAGEIAIGIQNALRFQEIQNFNVTLQEEVEKATRKLRKTNEKLRELDQIKDDFISMSSHQLRTPLTAIKGYISMVLEGDVGQISPLQRKLLNQAFVSSQRMVYLISDLLNVSRLRTGKFVIETSPTNLATIAKEEIGQLKETAKSRGLELELLVPDPAQFPTVLLDNTKMRQVIMNFVDNAIYYTPSGGRIAVKLEEKPASIEFTVTDSGIGVPKSEQFRLFTKFYRAPNARKMRPDGTGLGLFMAKKVVMAQGGSIVFKSHEGRGSVFGFSFIKNRLHFVED
jgi:signal transduction histidine kinase